MSSGKAGAGKQTNPKAPVANFANPQIMKMNVEKNRLTNLLNKFQQWKNEYSQALQQYDIKSQFNRDKQAMLNSEQVRFECLVELFCFWEILKSNIIEFILGEKNIDFIIIRSFTG